jgi:hypothetical protein
MAEQTKVTEDSQQHNESKRVDRINQITTPILKQSRATNAN